MASSGLCSRWLSHAEASSSRGRASKACRSVLSARRAYLVARKRNRLLLGQEVTAPSCWMRGVKSSVSCSAATRLEHILTSASLTDTTTWDTTTYNPKCEAFMSELLEAAEGREWDYVRFMLMKATKNIDAYLTTEGEAEKRGSSDEQGQGKPSNSDSGSRGMKSYAVMNGSRLEDMLLDIESMQIPKPLLVMFARRIFVGNSNDGKPRPLDDDTHLVHALQVLRWLRKSSITQQIEMVSSLKDYTKVVNVLLKKSKSFKNAKGGNPYQQRAYETWLDMRSFYGDKLDAAAVRSGMNACVVTRRTEEAETIFEDSVSCSSSSSSSDEEEESSSIAFNILIKGYGYERNLDKLDRVMPKMKELGAQPTESTYNTLVNAYTNMNRVDKAWRVMQDAVQRGNDNKKEINTKVVSEDCKQYMYATILKGFIKSVNFEGSGMQPAIDLINQMKLKGVEPDVYVYAQLMDYLIKKRKDVDAAEYLFQQMQLGSNGGVAPNVVVYNILLRGYSDQEGKGWLRMKSLELLKEMGTKGIKPNSSTFNTLISAAASNGDSQAASKLFNLMVDLKVEPDRMTFTTIMKNFSDLRMPDEVARVFKQLDASAFGGADKIAFNCLIGAYGKAGQLAEAEAAYYKMMNRSIKPDRVTFNSLVRACCSEKSMKSAVMFIKMASGKQIRIAMPLYDLTLKACIAEESFDLASDILTSMEQVRIKRREFKIREDFVSFSLEEHKKKKLSSAKKDEREKGNSVAMERVKFWMGLPNQYYSDSDEDWRQ